jgi:hypothetical protein
MAASIRTVNVEKASEIGPGREKIGLDKHPMPTSPRGGEVTQV